MDVEQHADAGRTQEADVRAVEPNGVMTMADFLRNGMLQFHARFRIDPALHSQFDDRLAERVRAALTSLDADIHAGRSGRQGGKYGRAKSAEVV